MNIQQRRISVGEIELHIREVGQGPLVVFCHGFPECGQSWVSQMQAVAQAGYRAVAPDMRGYGGSDVPEQPQAYSMLHLVGDVVGLVGALGAANAVVVGHDWGASVAWHCALLRPDLFKAVAALSVPFFPRGSTPPVSSMPSTPDHEFYQLYFQRPGEAEAEMMGDLRANLIRAAWHFSGDAAPTDLAALSMVPRQGGWLSGRPLPDRWPSWLREDDLNAYVTAFERTGFTGALNWYRNLDTNWRLLAPWQGSHVQVPALYMVGARDLLMGFPVMDWLLPRLKNWVPQLVHQEIVPGCGHWIQRERAELVNQRLLDFLSKANPV